MVVLGCCFFELDKERVIYIYDFLKAGSGVTAVVIMSQPVAQAKHLQPAVILNEFVGKCLLKGFPW